MVVVTASGCTYRSVDGMTAGSEEIMLVAIRPTFTVRYAGRWG